MNIIVVIIIIMENYNYSYYQQGQGSEFHATTEDSPFAVGTVRQDKSMMYYRARIIALCNMID
jgi:hypothetical protein